MTPVSVAWPPPIRSSPRVPENSERRGAAVGIPLGMPDLSAVTYRRRSTAVVDTALCTFGLVLFASVFFADGFHGPSHVPIACVSGAAVVVLAPATLRATRAATLIVERDELVYRSWLWTYRIPRQQIESVDAGLRPRGVLLMRHPRLHLTSGKVRWLEELSVRARPETSRSNRELDALVADISRWLTGASPR